MSDVLLSADQVADTVRQLLGDRLLTRDQLAEASSGSCAAATSAIAS